MLFSVPTPLGFSVRTTGAYWDFIERKRPEVRGKANQVRRCLEAPDIIRRSKQDRTVHLFYSRIPPYHLVVVTKRLDGEGFVITSYITDKINEGEQVWPTFE